MSMTQTTPEVTPPGEPSCQSCGIQLPLLATFCASCGERVTKKQITAPSQDNRDIATRYRITTLVRRRSPVSLFLATDTELQRPIALRDIDITSLNDEERNNAAAAVQREYDLLRHLHAPFVIPLIDLRHFQSHLYIATGWPRNEKGSHNHLHTLQDVLQSGKGLPTESMALTWIEHLCQSLQNLHASGIIVADLDPQTLILNGDSYVDELALMVSWLPPSLRSLFPRTSTIANSTNYTAPEVLLGKTEPRSDIYSLGALLYLLLTGIPPEEPIARTQRRLRLPSELNSRSSTSLDDFISQALALDAADRFSHADEMRSALLRLRAGGKRTHTAKDSPHKSKVSNITNNNNGHSSGLPISTEDTLTGGILHNGKHNDHNNDHNDHNNDHNGKHNDHNNDHNGSNGNNGSNTTVDNEQRIDKISAADTIVVTPLAKSSWDQRTWQLSLTAVPATPTNSNQAIAETIKETPRPNVQDEWIEQTASTPLQKRNLPVPVSSSPTNITGSDIGASQKTNAANGTSSFFQKMQRLILGEQKRTTTAAAIVETPLRVQPDQHYHIRIHIMGRNTAVIAPNSKNSAITGGLSSLVEGDTVFIEVRSALYQNYAYIVQEATVQIPESGYAAEVTIPMHPLSLGPSGRRDRLHIFFMDAKHRTLYEKPFIVELFISHLVQSGREGHNVLTIPL